jgi:hypothetical protein
MDKDFSTLIIIKKYYINFHQFKIILKNKILTFNKMFFLMINIT